MKKLLMALILGVLLMSLTACSNKQAPSESGQSTSTTQTTASSATMEEGQAGNTTTTTKAATSTSVGGFIIVDSEIELTEDE